MNRVLPTQPFFHEDDMKILVTGASGFIGGWLLKALHKTSHETATLIRATTPEETWSTFINTESIFLDEKEPELLAETLAGFRQDVVIHMASYFVAENQPKDVSRLIEGNIDFPTRLLEA